MRNAAIVTRIKKLFEDYTKKTFAEACAEYVTKDCKLKIDDSNFNSWSNCFEFLTKHLDSKKWGNYPILFEYMMPESLKRADVIILGNNNILVLEFKQKEEILSKDISQTAEYKKSISEYHQYTVLNKMQVSAYLVYTSKKPEKFHMDNIHYFYKNNFSLDEIFLNDTPLSLEKTYEWVNSSFELPKNMIESAVSLFKKGKLPYIKSVAQGDITKALISIHKIIDNSNEKNIIFISGVPGAGKTLIGLQCVYDYLEKDLRALPQNKIKPLFVSGNGPLINILKKELNNTLIMHMYDFKKNAYNEIIPANKLIVFDEAQRAWDCGQENNMTEAKELLAIGEKIAKNFGTVTIICLIGIGQEIHVHEESGLQIWHEALKGRKDWSVTIPQKLEQSFKGIKAFIDPALYLDVSIRNNFININPWVDAVLESNLNKAKKEYQKLLLQGFKLGIICQTDKAIDGIHPSNPLHKAIGTLLAKFPKTHTGIVVSSHAKNFDEKKAFGSQYQGSYIEKEKAHEWFKNDSNSLKKGASEFTIQGIEIDWPIVTFAGDYFIHDGKWIISNDAAFDARIKDRNKIMQNTYRVLLTRSRKGMLIYIPQNNKMAETANWFKEMIH